MKKYYMKLKEKKCVGNFGRNYYLQKFMKRIKAPFIFAVCFESLAYQQTKPEISWLTTNNKMN